MAGEIQLNSVTLATESGGVVSIDSSVAFPAGHVTKFTKQSDATTTTVPLNSEVTVNSTTYTPSSGISFLRITAIVKTSSQRVDEHLVLKLKYNGTLISSQKRTEYSTNAQSGNYQFLFGIVSAPANSLATVSITGYTPYGTAGTGCGNVDYYFEELQ